VYSNIFSVILFYSAVINHTSWSFLNYN